MISSNYLQSITHDQPSSVQIANDAAMHRSSRGRSDSRSSAATQRDLCRHTLQDYLLNHCAGSSRHSPTCHLCLSTKSPSRSIFLLCPDFDMNFRARPSKCANSFESPDQNLISQSIIAVVSSSIELSLPSGGIAQTGGHTTSSRMLPCKLLFVILAATLSSI